jgi:hypothetical protein
MNKKINIEVSTKGAIQNYWLAIGFNDVILENGKGNVTHDDSHAQILTWWMIGNSGDSLSIALTDQTSNEVLTIKESKIPPGEIQGAGTRRFQP